MGEVRIYRPDRFASEAVGTPGADKTAGADADALARGVGGIRSREAELAGAEGGLLLDAVVGAGTLLGIKLNQVQRAKAQQKQYLADAQLAQDEQDLRQFAFDKKRELEKGYMNDPEKGSELFRDALKERSAQVAAKYEADPRMRARYADAVKSFIPGENEKMDSWATSRRTAIAQQNVKNTKTTAIQQIGQLTGTIEERKAAFKEIAAGYEQYINKQVGIVGLENAEKEALSYNEDSSEAFFEGLIQNNPKDPIEGIKYAKTIKDELDNAAANKFTLTDAARRRLENEANALESRYVKISSDKTLISELETTTQYDRFKITLNANRDNKLFQQQAINDMSKRVAEVQAQSKKIIDDPDMPEPIKLRTKQWEHSVLGQINSTMNAAYSHINAKEAEERRERREDEREQRQAVRDYEKSVREEKARAKAELAERKTDAKSDMQDLHTRLTELASDDDTAIRNRDELFRTAAEMYKQAHLMREAGLLTPEQAGSKQREALRIVKGTARWYESSGFFGYGAGKVEVTDKNELLQRQGEAIEEVMKAVGDLKAQQQDAAQSKIAQLTPTQEAAFSKLAAQVRAVPGLSPQELQRRLSALQNRVVAQVK